MKILQNSAYTPLRPKEIVPTGWLRRQLEIQAEGLAGNLDKVWPDVRDSRWIGGDREGWERVPYWLDGFIPLAYLLDREDMKARAIGYVDAILARQQPDGWICPCGDAERPDYDVWGVFLICKVLVLYHDCSGDARIEESIYRTLRQLNSHLDRHTLFDWGQARWFECYIPLLWLYARRQEPWLLQLAHKLRVQGMDWRQVFEDWQYETPGPHGEWTYMTHVVNIAMALKAEALLMQVEDTPANVRAKAALSLLRRDHGMATGHFTGDECLSGTSPVQGSELCGVVEAMYSYEHLLAATGDAYWGDMLERLAYNALPATMSPDMWTHQYDQMTNQVQCTPLAKEHTVFRTNNGESHLFGLEPNFGCCTANMGQGWPKFALSTVMRTPDGLAITAIAPVEIHTEINGVPVCCRVETEYPFRDAYAVTIIPERPVRFALTLRVPEFAQGAYVDGGQVQLGKQPCVDRVWEGIQTIRVSLLFDATLVQRPSGMHCLTRGPLLFAVAPQTEWTAHEYVKEGVERKAPYCDYLIKPKSPWNYAFAGATFEKVEQPISSIPFSPDTPPIALSGDMVQIPWEAPYGVCGEKPKACTPLSAVEKVALIPYGCTTLRMTEMPRLVFQSQ